MWYILASIIVLGFIAAWLDKRYKRKLKQKVESGEIPKLPSIKDQDSECCGMHEICRKGESISCGKQRNRILR